MGLPIYQVAVFSVRINVSSPFFSTSRETSIDFLFDFGLVVEFILTAKDQIFFTIYSTHLGPFCEHLSRFF